MSSELPKPTFTDSVSKINWNLWSLKQSKFNLHSFCETSQKNTEHLMKSLVNLNSCKFLDNRKYFKSRNWANKCVSDDKIEDGFADTPLNNKNEALKTKDTTVNRTFRQPRVSQRRNLRDCHSETP